ncbi:MAG: thiamine pyridinylase [Bradyrhizobium sp.]|jgi:thiamine pyridinylase|nr:thiamine pyridinylase [Bradyrhizobium sp.]
MSIATPRILPASGRRALLALAVVLVSEVFPVAAFAVTLKVALYPYVPRLDQFETAIREAWSTAEPTVPLTFTAPGEWDGGYKKDPPNDVDVYVFDAMYFEYFRQQNLVAMDPAEVLNKDDFLPYARQAVLVDDKYYAIPQLGCANILFYNKDDAAIANAATLEQLQGVLGKCTFTSEIPPDKRGLMLDMAGSTTNATLYLDIAHSVNGTYPLPKPSQPPNASYITNQKAMLNMSSFWDITSENPDAYIRGVWYSQGYGRAFMGFTETMERMTPQALDGIGFKVMPLSNVVTNPPLFYVDAIGVNTTSVQRNTRDLAVKLANVIASADVVVASFRKRQQDTNPQYLMSVRNSAFTSLGNDYPIYKRMHQLATSSNPVAFKLDHSVRSWMPDFANTVRTEVRANYACGCDQVSGETIANNAAAPPICAAVCQNHGGWNGEWTNQQQPTPRSVCGCKACPLQ